MEKPGCLSGENPVLFCGFISYLGIAAQWNDHLNDMTFHFFLLGIEKHNFFTRKNTHNISNSVRISRINYSL